MSAQTAFIIFLALVALAVGVGLTRPARRAEDIAISKAMTAALAQEYPLNNCRIEVKAVDGVVILGGYAQEREQVRRAVELARAVQGVTSVDERVVIRSGH